MIDSSVVVDLRAAVSSIRMKSSTEIAYKPRHDILVATGRAVLRASDGIRTGAIFMVSQDIEEDLTD